MFSTSLKVSFNSEKIQSMCRLSACLNELTNVNLIIGQGVTDEVELEHAEGLRKLLQCHRIAYNIKKI